MTAPQHTGTWIGPVIERGVPLPPSKKAVHRTRIALMRKMEPGDSIRMDDLSEHAINALARRIWGAGKYTHRSDLGGHRLWRGRCKNGVWS